MSYNRRLTCRGCVCVCFQFKSDLMSCMSFVSVFAFLWVSKFLNGPVFQQKQVLPSYDTRQLRFYFICGVRHLCFNLSATFWKSVPI